MTGLILCGGMSSRMGSDKGLLQVNNVSWVEKSAFLLSSLDIPVLISVNKNQVKAYADLFTEESLVIDNETLDLKGPLLGIMSAHLMKPAEDLFVLACDMISMNENVLQRIYNEYTTGDADAYVYTIEQSREPLCAIYTSSALGKIHELVYIKQLKNFSMMHVLDKLHVLYLQVDSNLINCFRNLNTPEQLY